MNILVIAATELEIAPFINNKKTDVLITGVGAAPAIYYLTKHLLAAEYDLVVQAGIAGSFHHNQPMAEVVLIEQDTFADAGIMETENYQTLIEAGLAKDEFPYQNGWLHNDHPLLAQSPLKKVRAITVNTVGVTTHHTNSYIDKFAPDIESMEGAALHYICLLENVPFIQIRAISNHVGIRDKGLWKMKEAIDNLSEELTILINQFNQQ